MSDEHEYPYEDTLGRRNAKWLCEINSNRRARGKLDLTPYGWDTHAELCRTYQNTDDPGEREWAMAELRKLDGEPSAGGLGVPENVMAAVELATR